MELIRNMVFMVTSIILGDSSAIPLDPIDDTDKIAENKRNEIFMPLFSIICSAIAAVSCLALQMILSVCLGPIKEDLKKTGALFGVTGIVCFIFSYKKMRQKLIPRIKQYGKNFNFIHDEFGGIYIKDMKTGGYRLSDKWCLVRDGMQWIIILDAIVLVILGRGILWGEEAFGIDKINMSGILSISGFYALLEVFYFLDYRKPEADKKSIPKYNTPLNLTRLKSCYDGETSSGLAVPTEIMTNHFPIKEDSEKMIWECREDENSYIKYFSFYLERKCRERGRDYHPHFIDTTMRLIRGQNVFFASVFYRDADICIFFPMYLSLIRGEHVLVLAEDNEDLDILRDWVKAGLEDVHGLKDLWNVEILEQFVNEVEVGILSFQELYQGNAVRWMADFFKTVSFVVILQPTNMVAGGQEELSFIATKIGIAVPNCVFLLFDCNTEGTLDLFSHLFNTKFYYVSATPTIPLELMTAYWSTEQEPLQVWEPIHRYLGLELRIAEIAWTANVQKVVWYGENVVPVRDLQWIIGQYYETYAKKTSRSSHQVSINWDLQCEIYGLSCEVTQEQFLILEDSNYNLLEVRRQFITRAQKKLALHILSPNYMMRNYMRSIKNDAIWDTKYIIQFMPEHVITVRNAAIYLIRKMLNEPVSEDEINERLNKCEEYKAERETENQVKELVFLVMNENNPQIKVTLQSKCSESFEGVIQKKFYQIIDEKLKNDFSRYFQRASYINENGQEKKISRLILAGHLDQKYLPGQYVTFDGIYYEIIGKIVKETMTALEVARASDQICGRKYYRQNREYSVTNSENYVDVVSLETDTMKISRSWKNIDGITKGYLSMDSLNDIASGHPVYLKNQEMNKRHYKEKQVLKIEFLTIPDEDKGQICIFGIVLHEIFCTLYPQYHHLLSVAVNQKGYQNLIKEKILKYVLSDINDTCENCLFILEDSREDMGLLRSVERNFSKIGNIINDYMKWSEETGDGYLKFGYSDDLI